MKKSSVNSVPSVVEDPAAFFAQDQILANAMSAFAPNERLPLDSGNNAVGQIVLANEARFTASFASEPLTNYAVGWKDRANIEATLDFLFPPVQAPRRFEFKKADNSEAFYSETDDLRAIGADFKRVEYKGTSVLEKTLNKGLTIRVDLDQVASLPNWRELYTARLLQRLPDIVLEFYAEDGVTPDDPTNFKRFWTPVDSGVAF